jgi:hypothetical protein
MSDIFLYTGESNPADIKLRDPTTSGSTPGTITGTMAAAEAGTDTFAGSCDVFVQGSLAASETGADTFSSTGDVVVQGTLAVSESGSDTLAASGTVGSVAVTGDLAATETGSDTCAFSGTVTTAPQAEDGVVGGGGIIRKQKKSPANFGYPLDARRSERHVPKTAKKIIERLAEKQVEERIRSGFEEQLVAALDAAELAYREFYLELLQIEREKLIDEQIKALFELKRLQDEEEEVLAMLLLM